MPRPLLPPRVVMIPVGIVYDLKLPSPLFQTLVELRGLAWGGRETPPLSFKQLSEITGKSQSTLYGHLRLLRSWNALRWRSSADGTLIVSFEPQPGACPSDSEDLEKSDPLSSSLIDRDFNLEALREGAFQKAALRESEDLEDPGEGAVQHLRFADLRTPASQDWEAAPEGVPEGAREGRFPGVSAPNWGMPACENWEAPPGSRGQDPARLGDPVAVYRAVTRLRPNPAQRDLLSAQVHDLELWQRTLEHWLSHGWNPRNVAGQLELYSRGGPSACRYCPSAGGRGQDPADTPLQRSLAAIEQARRELC